MKKIITVNGNEDLNNMLRKFNDIEVKERDIFYKEGVLDFLEKDSDLDIIILSEELFGDELFDYLKNISIYKISIYIITNKKHYMEEFESFSDIKLFNTEEDIIDDLENSNYSLNKSNNCLLKNTKRVMSIIGSYGVGKTIFCSLLGKTLAKTNKVLLVNFDIFSNNLKYLFDIKKQITSYSIESLITKSSKNLYILNGIKYIFNETNKINTYKVKELLDQLKNSFDYIVIDTSSEISLKYIKTIFPNCDYNIFLIESNSLEIKKAKELLEIYVMDFNLDLNKTGIFINKYNIDSIDTNIIKQIFKDIKVLGKVNYTPKINSYINTYTKNNIKVDDIVNFKKYLKGEIKNR